MIQRIQSVWLFLASICAFATIRFSTYVGTDSKNIPYQKITGANGGLLILATTILVGLLAAIAIFLFKNRNTQLWVCLTGVLSEILLMFLYSRGQGTFSLSAGILHPFIIFFFILAARGIFKDKKVISESDRLR